MCTKTRNAHVDKKGKKVHFWIFFFITVGGDFHFFHDLQPCLNGEDMIRLQSPPETKSLQGPKQIHRERLQAVCPCGVDQPCSNILKKSEIPPREKLTNWKQIGKRNKNKKSEMTETLDQPHSSISFSSMVSTTVVEQRYQSKGDGGRVGGVTVSSYSALSTRRRSFPASSLQDRLR